jgi:hypothetical protein
MKLTDPVEHLQRRKLTPEEGLMVAVLKVSIIDFSGAKQLADGRDADTWFQRRDKDSPFCFESICEHFNLDANSIRQALPGD